MVIIHVEMKRLTNDFQPSSKDPSHQQNDKTTKDKSLMVYIIILAVAIELLLLKIKLLDHVSIVRSVFLT